MRRFLLIALFASSALAQSRYPAASRPTCTNLNPREIFIIDSTTQQNCTTTGGGAAEAHCCCQDGVWQACGTGSSGTTVADGDYGDITVTVSGTVWTIERPRRPSWDNPPSSPSSYNDEFDTTTLDAKWTIGSSGTTNPAAAGSIDYTASLTTPVVDAATIAGALAFQSDNSSAQATWVRQSFSAATDATLFFSLSPSNRELSAINEGSIFVRILNTGDANEWIDLGITQNGSGYACYAQVNNNGATTTPFTTVLADGTITGQAYFALWKKSDVYYAACAWRGSVLKWFGTVTKTGVTTLDAVQIVSNTANETPSLVNGADFFRYYAFLNYGLVNP